MLNYSAFKPKKETGLNLSAFGIPKQPTRMLGKILDYPTWQPKTEAEKRMKEAGFAPPKPYIPREKQITLKEKLKYLPEELPKATLTVFKKIGSFLSEAYGGVWPETISKMREGKGFIEAYKETWKEMDVKEKVIEDLVKEEYAKAEKAGASRWELSKIASKSPMAQKLAYGAFFWSGPIGFTTKAAAKDILLKQSKAILKKYKIVTKKDYYSAMHKYHPDVSRLPNAEQITKQINAAWGVKNMSPGAFKKTSMQGLKDLWTRITRPKVPTERAIVPFKLIGKPKIAFKMTPAEKLKLVGKVPATTHQMAQAHILAKEKAMLSLLGKVKPQYRALAKGITGKTSMKEMTKQEADRFITALKQIQPRFIQGEKYPPIIPTTKQITTPGFFEKEFGKPTFAKYLTPSDRYARSLGVYEIIEPSIKAKTKLLLERQGLFKWLDGKEKEVLRLEKIGLAARIKAGIKAKPTVAHKKWFELLDKNKTAKQAGLTGEQGKIFDELRKLTEVILQRTNEVRLQVGLPPIQSLKTYITHISDIASKKILQEKYPFPEEVKYWLNYIQPKHIYNPTALHRLLEDRPGLLKNPFKALKTMVSMDLKQIYLEKPNILFREQLAALKGKIPAETKKWVELYVNEVIKGYPTALDELTNNTLNTLGITGLIDKVLAPFGRTVGLNPAKEISGALSRLIHDAVIWGRLKLVVRNHTQKMLTLGLYGYKSFVKGLFPANKELQTLIKNNDFWKISNREFMERLPEGALGQLERIGYKPYGHSHISNVGNAMKVSYYASMDLVKNPKYAKLGWTMDDVIKEMEFGANTTQYWYNLMGMPEIYRSGIGRTFGVLQTWWQNYLMKYWREMLARAFTGKTGWGKEIPVSWRLGALRHIITSLLFIEGTRRALGWDYKRIALFGVFPTYLSPPAQIVMGMYNYMFATTDWAKTKAKKQIFQSWKAFIPGSMAWKDFWEAWETGNVEELLFYTEYKEPRTGGLKAPGSEILAPRGKLIAP